MTYAERTLWSYLRNKQLGVKFRRQHPIGNFIVDFYSRESSLVVEVDGGHHFNDDIKKYDSIRDTFFKNLGFKVLRFSNREIKENIKGVVEIIAYYARQKTLDDDPTKQWKVADELEVGNVLFFTPFLRKTKIKNILKESYSGELFDLQIEKSNSYLTTAGIVHSYNN